jgi:hypothetical protein
LHYYKFSSTLQGDRNDSSRVWTGVDAHNHILETSARGDHGMATLTVLKFENVSAHPPVPEEGQAGKVYFWKYPNIEV